MTDLPLALKRPLIYLPALLAAAAIAGLAALVMLPAQQAVVVVATPAGPLLVAKEAMGRERSCDSCGTVHSIRSTDPATGLPAYAFSVRMRDGSTRESTGAKRGRWIEGERVILIGGTAARAREVQKNAAL